MRNQYRFMKPPAGIGRAHLDNLALAPGVHQRRAGRPLPQQHMSDLLHLLLHAGDVIRLLLAQRCTRRISSRRPITASATS
jgi:hypothetical protein